MPFAREIYFCELGARPDQSTDVFHNIETDIGNFSGAEPAEIAEEDIEPRPLGSGDAAYAEELWTC